MTTDYDPIAEQYRLCKRQEWRVFVEAHTLMEIVGTERGAALDIACGEGFYTRLLRQRGAARVTGIDLSSQMIELARRQEALLDLGVTYLCGDATRLPPTAEYDLALAAYLLNYAHDRSELQAMCTAIAGVIKPGGRFITVNCNPDRHFPTAPSFRKYGFETEAIGRWKEGCPIRWTFHLDQGPFAIENYWLDAAIHDEALRRAGFSHIRWHRPQVSPEGIREHGREYWSDLLDQAPIAFLECTKES